MTTKKVDDTDSSPRLERGRLAMLLAAGCTIEAKPSPKQETIEMKTATSSAASRPSKA